MSRAQRLCLGVSLCILVAGWCGCAHMSRGTRLAGERIEFIKDGITPRSQVLYNLGEPLFDFPEHRTIGYEWEMVERNVLAGESKDSEVESGRERCYMTEGEWERALERNREEKRLEKAKRGAGFQAPEMHILLVKFDRANRVIRHGTVVAKDTEPLREVVSKWLQSQ